MLPGFNRLKKAQPRHSARWTAISQTFFDFLSRCVTQHPWWMIGAWAAMLLLVTLSAPAWKSGCQDDDIRFMPDRCLSVRGYDLLQRAFPKEVYGSKLIVAVERNGASLSEADELLINRLCQSIENIRKDQPRLGIRQVRGPTDPLIGARLCSQDDRCRLIVVGLETPFLAERTRLTLEYLESQLRREFDAYVQQHDMIDGMRMILTGPAGMGRDLNDAIMRSFHGTTIATIALVIVTLLWVYRSIILAMIPLVSIGVSAWISLQLLSWLAVHTGLSLVNITHVFIVVILFGVGTDYCLFMISRMREEEKMGQGGPEVVRQSVAKVGWAITASAATVICAVGLLGFAEFVKVRSSGPAIAISLFVALIACLTLTPALLVVVNKWRARPGYFMKYAARSYRQPKSRWNGFVQRCLKRSPAKVMACCLVLLLPLAFVGWSTECVYAVCNDLPPGSASRLGLEMIKDHFTPGETGPLSIMLSSPISWWSPISRNWLTQTLNEIQRLDDVADIRGMTAPLGYRTKDHGDNQIANWLRTASVAFAGLYISEAKEGHITRIEVIMKDDPFGVESQRTLERIEKIINEQIHRAGIPGLKYCHFGVTSIMRDIAVVQRQDNRRISILVILCILVIMFVLVKRFWLSLFLVGTVLFSYLVTVGFTSMTGHLWLGSAWAQLDWKVPFFLFTILVAVGEDYNIFLVSRILENEAQWGLAQATLISVEQTGSAITSCGLIMAGTFASLMLGELVTLRQLGMALAVGVLLDTFVMRLFVVPSGLLLFAKLQRSNLPMTKLDAALTQPNSKIELVHQSKN